MSKTLSIQPRQALTGINYAVQFENQTDIYVSPAIYSLFKTDPDELLKTLRVKVIKEKDPDNPFKKNKRYALHPKFRGRIISSQSIRKGENFYGLLPNMLKDVNQGKYL